MPTDFAEYEDLISEVIDDVHGEDVRLVSVTKNEFAGGGADPLRPAYTVTGIVDINPLMAQATDKGQYDGYQVNIGADRVHISIDDDAFDQWRPVTGDTVHLLQRTKVVNGEVVPKELTVKDPQSDGLGRTVLICAWR